MNDILLQSACTSRVRSNFSGVFENDATRPICGFLREEAAANKDKRQTLWRPAARHGGLDAPSISRLSYRLECPPTIYLSAGGGAPMAVTPCLMNLLVCRSKHAHLPDFPQLLHWR